MKAALLLLSLALIGSAASARPAVAPKVAPPKAIAPPKWNPRAAENVRVLPHFSYATVELVLNAIGARHQRAGVDGKPAILATFPNGRKAMLLLSACDDKGACKALSIQSYWTKIANAPPAQTADAIEKFNQRFSFAKAFVAEDGRPALQRYLTADYGFIRGNLAVNLLVFASQADQFANDVLKPLEASKK